MLAGFFAMRRQHKTLLAAGAGLDAESQLLQSGADLGPQPALLRLDRYRDAGGGIKQPRDLVIAASMAWYELSPAIRPTECRAEGVRLADASTPKPYPRRRSAR